MDRQSIHVRIPLSLLERMRDRAEDEGVSLNTWLTAMIAGHLGYPVEDEATQ